MPNILIIMNDDQGPWAMNCAGTPEMQVARSICYGGVDDWE